MSREYEAVYDLWICCRSEASPPFRAGLPGKEGGHFCVAPLDPRFQAGLCGEQAGHGVPGRDMGALMSETGYNGVDPWALNPAPRASP
jgi:hypothetical protein